MKKIIVSMMLILAATICCTPVFAEYTDISSSAWYSKYVQKITDLKAFEGYEDGSFRPDNEITQEEFVKTVVSLISSDNPTSDKQTTEKTPRWADWATPYFNRAVELGLITDTDYTLFYNGVPCSRGVMAMIAARAVDYMSEDPISDTSAYRNKLKDYANIEDKYKPFVLQAFAKGIISGYPDGHFKADGSLTRAEASSVLVRLVDKAERVDADEKTYDYFGRQVTWTEPLRTDVPEQYQVSLSDLLYKSQSSFEESLSLGVSIDTSELNYSKALMFEDLVLQSLRYDGDTITFELPDLLPQGQRWCVNIGYWDITKDFDFMNIKGFKAEEPGEYTIPDVKVLERIQIIVLPEKKDDFVTSQININNGYSLTLERLPTPTVTISDVLDGKKVDHKWQKGMTTEWVQGRGCKDYYGENWNLLW